MSVFGKHKAKLITAALLLTLLIWWLMGVPGGYIPGRYDAESKTYDVFWDKKGFVCQNGYFRIKFYTPFKKYGLCDTNGRVIIPFRYDNIGDLEPNGLLTFTRNKKLGVINLKQEIIAPPEWDRISIYEKEIYAGKGTAPNAEYVLLGLTGKPIFTDTVFVLGNVALQHNRSHRFAFALKDTVSYIYFGDGQKILTLDYFAQSYKFLGDDTATVMVIYGQKQKGRSKSKVAVVGMTGEELLPLEFDYVQEFAKPENVLVTNLLLIGKRPSEGMYDINQKKWIWPLFPGKIDREYAIPLFRLKSEKGKIRYIDAHGTVILSEKISVISWQGNELLFVRNNQHYRMRYDKAREKFIWYNIR